MKERNASADYMLLETLREYYNSEAVGLDDKSRMVFNEGLDEVQNVLADVADSQAQESERTEVCDTCRI